MPLHRFVAVTLVLLLGSGCTSDGEPVDPPATATAPAATDSATDSASPAAPPVEANPAVKVTGTCTPEPLQDAGGTYVEALLKVRNTGNIGAQVRVAAAWPVDGTQRLARTRSFKLRPGKSRELTVRLALTPEDADGITAALEQGRKCRFSGRVIGAFGRPVED